MQAETTVRSRNAEVERAIEQRIHERTWGRVRNLQVELRDEQVVVHGCTPTYYLKQLALEAAREVLGANRRLFIDIQVI
jgi:hypothetical protein